MNEIADSQPPANDSDQNRTVNPTKADGKRTPFTSSAPISQRHLEQIELLDRKISAALRLVRPTATPHTAPQRRSKPKPWGPRNSAKGPAKRSARAPHSDTNSGQISTKSSDYARVDLEIVGTRPSRAYRGKPSAEENSSKQDPSSTIADNRGSYDTLVGDKQDRNLWLRQATSTLNTKQGSAVSTSTSDVTTAATTKSIEHEGTLTEGTMQVAPPLTSPVKSSREVSARWDQHARQTPMASPLENAERSKVTSPASSSHNTPATNPSPTVGSGREAVSSSKQRASYQRSEAPFLSDLDLDKEADRLLHEYEQSLRAVGLGLELEEAESKSPVSSEDSFLSLSRGASRFGPVTEQSHGSFQRDGVVRDDEGVDDLGLEKSDNIVARLKSRLDNVFEAEVHRESSPGFSVGNTSMDKLTEVPKQLETSMDPLRDSIFGANRDSQDSLRLSDSMRLSASVESNGFDTHSEASPTKSTGETDPSATAIGTNNKSNDTLAHSEDDITSNVVERIDAQASSEVRPVDASTRDHGVNFGCDGAESEDVNVASCGGSPSSATDTSLDESAERILSRIEDQHAELLHGDTASVDSDSDSDNDAPILTGASPSTQQAPLLSENGIIDSTFDGVAQNSSNTERNLAADAATRSAPPPPLQQFSMFERVECRYGGGETYYPGSIAAVNEDGTYNIGYDDGDAESNVDTAFIRRAAGLDAAAHIPSNAVETEAGAQTDAAGGSAPSPPSRPQFTVFERVECRYGGGETYYPGSIAAVNEDGTYNIGYDDGDAESHVDISLIRSVVATDTDAGTSAAPPPSLQLFALFERVECRFGGRETYYPGSIAAVSENGTYRIRYDDGDVESNVDASLIRRVAAPDTDAATSSAQPLQPQQLSEDIKVGEPRFSIFERVECRYGARHRFYPGSIAAVNADGTYEIVYDDEDSESNVAEALIRILPTNVANAQPQRDSPVAIDDEGETKEPDREFALHDRVECRFSGGLLFYAGAITAVNQDGTYDIGYDDGDAESNVDASLIRRVAGSDYVAHASSNAVEAEADVEAGSAPLPPCQQFSVSERVECRYGGGETYYPGSIAAVNEDGTYRIRYDDGDVESNVDASFIRRATGSDAAAHVPSNGVEAAAGAQTDKATSPAPLPPRQQFSVSERVECRYGGGETYYPGSIAAVNGDGTYNIGYDDGDAESNVDGSLIRGVAAADGSSNAVEAEADTATTSEQPPPRQQFTVFERVECRYGGGETYYPGSISAVNEDGTYNIGYDDGDAESNVDGSLIRGVAAADGSSNAVEAEADTATTSEQPPPRQQFTVFERVECRYGGGETYYPGSISAVNEDGTYNIGYDDGDAESNVDGSLIRRIVALGPAAPVASDTSMSASQDTANLSALPFAEDSPMWRQVAFTIFRLFDPDQTGIWTVAQINAHQKATASDGEPAEQFSDASSMSSTFRELGFRVEGTGENRGLPFQSVWKLYQMHGEMLLDYVCVFAWVVIVGGFIRRHGSTSVRRTGIAYYTRETL